MIVQQLKKKIILGMISAFCVMGISETLLAASVTELWQSAIRAHLSKNYAKSSRLLETYLTRVEDPAKVEAARFFLAENYRFQGQDSKALLIYQNLNQKAAKGPLKISSQFRTGELAYNRGRYKEAADLFNRLANDSKADFLFPQIPLAQVKTNLKLQRRNQAKKVFDQLIESFPRSLLDPEIKFLYGIMKEYQGKHIDALKIYEELGENSLARLFTGAIYESQGRFLEAVESYNKVLDFAEIKSHREMANYFKIRAFYKSGDFLSAESLCSNFLTIYPKSEFRAKAALMYLLISLAQAQFEDVMKNNERFATALAMLDPADHSLLQYVLGEAALNLDRFPTAIKHYQAALPQSKANRAEILLKLSYTYLAVANWDEAYKKINTYFRHAKKIEPFAYLVLMRANLQTQREQGAFRAVQTLARTKSPQIQLGLYYLAEYYMSKGKSRKLVTQWPLLENILQKESVLVEYREVAAWARLLVADAYYQEKNYSLSREYYQKALMIHPRGRIEMFVYAGLTWCHFQLQDYNSVRIKSEKLFAKKDLPNDLIMEISLLQAHAYFNLKEYDRSIQAYRKWIETGPKHPDVPRVQFQIGWAYYLNKSYLDAVDTWMAMADDFPNAPETQEALFWVADTYFQAGENMQARKIYQSLLKKYPESPQCKAFALRIAQTYYNQQKDEESIRRFTSVMVNYPDTEEAKEAQNGIEAASYRITDIMNTIPAFRDYISKFSESNLAEDIQYRIGEAYYLKEMYKESLAEFLQFVLIYTKSPRTPNAQYYISVCQEQIGNLAESVAQADAFIKNYPQHELAPEMMFRLASGEFQLEKFSEAAQHFVECAENYALKEYQPRAWYNAAVTYEKIEMPDQALVYYEKLVKHYPDDPNTVMSFSRMVMMNAMQHNQEGVDAALALMESKQDKALLQKTWLGLAVLYKEQDELGEYEKILLRIMQDGVPATKEYSIALVELASMYEGEKDWSAALDVYQRLAKHTTEPKWRSAAKSRIKLLNRIIKSQQR